MNRQPNRYPPQMDSDYDAACRASPATRARPAGVNPSRVSTTTRPDPGGIGTTCGTATTAAPSSCC